MEKKHGSGNNGCCKEEIKVVKDSKDQKLNQLVSSSIKLKVTDAYPATNQLAIPVVSPLNESYSVSHSPPRTMLKIYVRHCVFLI